MSGGYVPSEAEVEAVAEALFPSWNTMHPDERSMWRRDIREGLVAAHAVVPAEACIHCGRQREAHGEREACLKAGYYGNRFTAPAPREDVDQQVDMLRRENDRLRFALTERDFKSRQVYGADHMSPNARALLTDLQSGEGPRRDAALHRLAEELAADPLPTPAPREDVAEVLVEHRYLCGSDRGVSPRWEQCSCGVRLIAAPDVPAWRLLAEHQAAQIARSFAAPSKAADR